MVVVPVQASLADVVKVLEHLALLVDDGALVVAHLVLAYVLRYHDRARSGGGRTGEPFHFRYVLPAFEKISCPPLSLVWTSL